MKRIKLYFIAFLILSIFNKNSLLINASIKDTNNNQNENNSKNQDIQNPENNSDKNYINNWNKIIHLCNDNKYKIAGIGSLLITGAIIYKKLLSNNNKNNIAIDLKDLEDKDIKDLKDKDMYEILNKTFNNYESDEISEQISLQPNIEIKKLFKQMNNKYNINNKDLEDKDIHEILNKTTFNNYESDEISEQISLQPDIEIKKLFKQMNNKYNINNNDDELILKEESFIIDRIEKIQNNNDNIQEYLNQLDDYILKFKDFKIYIYLNNKKDIQTINNIKNIIITFIQKFKKLQ